jgi:hypothetical protein
VLPLNVDYFGAIKRILDKADQLLGKVSLAQGICFNLGSFQVTK